MELYVCVSPTRFEADPQYILYLLPAPFSPQSCWGTYPNTPIPQLTKFYYLAQLGWWFHQIYVINTEKRRHDHWQMFSHHVLTIALVTLSYIGNFTRVGTVIHVLMDFCDILLPVSLAFYHSTSTADSQLAKMFRYLSFITLCDSTFVLFLLSWLATRQIGLSYMIYTSWVHAPQLNEYKWDPATEHYMSEAALNGFIAMEIILLGLATMWFFMACRVAVRVLRGQGAEDVRSDGEEECEDRVEGKGVKEGLHIEVDGTGSGESTPTLASASGMSTDGAQTPMGVESVGGGGEVPEVSKGLEGVREDKGARRRK